MGTPFTGYLSDNVKFTVDAPTGAGTTTISSTILDMSGWDGVCFVVRVGTAAANNGVKAQQDTVVGFGGGADLLGSNVASGSNNVVVLDLNRPVEQFVRCQVVRGTSTTIDTQMAIQYKGRSLPVSIASTISYEQWNALAEGSA